MGTLMIKCPKTGRAIATGIQMVRSTFNNMPVFFARTLCPICQTQHEWFARNAWVRELEAQDDQPINLARTNRRPSTGEMRARKLMATIAIFAAAAVAAGFVAGTAAVDASPVSGSAVGRADSSTVAQKLTTYAVTFPEANRATKGNRLRVLIPDDQGGAAFDQANKDRSNGSIQKRAPREVERKPVAHCEPVGSPIADPAILDVPGRCFAKLEAFRQYTLVDSVAASFLG